MIVSKYMSFFKSLENWQSSLETCDYQANPDGNILNKIIHLQKSENIDKLIDLWKKTINKSTFELPHPTQSNMICKAVKNWVFPMTNFIYMVDKDNKNPWIIAQSTNFIDLIITPEKLFHTSKFKNGTIYPHISKLAKHIKRNEDLFYVDKEFGFLVDNPRPYHFFYDQFKYVVNLKNDAPLKNKEIVYNGFYNENNKDIDKNKVYLLPTIASNLLFPPGKHITIKKFNEKMENQLKGNSEFKTQSNKLLLWYGITGQKRSWLQQVSGFQEITSRLSEYFDEITVFVDGMTAKENEKTETYEDLVIFNQLAEVAPNNCELISLIDENYKNKIKIANNIDIFIANAGTGCMVPMRFCRKPGVIHSNTQLTTFKIPEDSLVKRTLKSLTKDVVLEGKERLDFLSYHIPWQHIYNLSVKIINKEKSTNIDIVPCPDIDTFMKNDNKDVNSLNKKTNLFSNLEKNFLNNYKTADCLRDLSLAMEKAGNISLALLLMKEAYELRPTGPFIQKKLRELYKKKEEIK